MSLPEVPHGFDRVAFDLDGTLAVNVYPRTHVGAAIKEGIDALLHYVEQGYEIVIYTSRPESHRERIWDWLREQRIAHRVYDVVCNKPHAGLYLDDRAHKPEWVRT